MFLRLFNEINENRITLPLQGSTLCHATYIYKHIILDVIDSQIIASTENCTFQHTLQNFRLDAQFTFTILGKNGFTSLPLKTKFSQHLRSSYSVLPWSL